MRGCVGTDGLAATGRVPNGFLRDTVFCLSAAEETVQRRYNVAAHGKLASIAAERGELAG